MQDLTTLLPEATLARLRAGYSHDAMVAANLAAVERVAPQLASWNAAIAAPFYDTKAILKPIDRERCLIALIATSGPPISLAMHVYWGLMEGLGVEEILHILALTGCYGGLPRTMFGIETMHRTLRALAAVDLEEHTDSPAAVRALLAELART
jgi:alkylhydroperoxidase/carboxymuconolactone decarboxylase family protein YurZ